MEKRYYSRCMYGNYKRYDFSHSGTLSEKSGTSYHFGRKKTLVGAILALLLIIGLCFTSCKPQQTVIKEETVTRYIDSTIWHTDTTYYQVPIEVYSDFTSLLDTLRLQTNYSIAWSAVDTNNMMLVGEIRNKDIKIPIQYVWKDRIIYQDSIVEKTKEIQVPVEVEKKVTPQWAWWTLFICIGLLGYVGWKVYRKFS